MDEVFISYARSSEALASRVAKGLEAAGFGVWRDDRLPAHRSYSEVIEQKLREAKAVVVLWSAEAAQSQWVRAEAELARSAGKLVQAVLDDTSPPIPFGQIQCANLKGWRGKSGHPGWVKVVESVSALVGGEAPATVTARPSPRWWQLPRMRWLAAAGVIMLVAAAFLLPRLIDRQDGARPVVAVLPFESLDSRDESLVSGIWEDTRHALSRNPQLLVLGPNTSEELASTGDKAARKAADYLVQASVRSNGDRVQVNANLVRTDDGAQVWSEVFERRLDDVFLMQQQIAGEIEGRIRGRLARGGGVKPENIATSGEVYALYSDARAKIRRRNFRRYDEAVKELQEVVERDPNFAPGWATLSVAVRVARRSTRQQGIGAETAEPYARRAIALAPNLAAGHAALGLALGDSPAAESALRRALRLDPNDVEALNWLAGAILSRGGLNEALEAYSRITEIEPLWLPAIINKLDVLLELKDFAGAERESARLKALGAENLRVGAEISILRARGDLSAAAAIGIPRLKAIPPEERLELFGLFDVMVQLGYLDEWRAIDSDVTPSVPYLWKNDPRGLDVLMESEKLSPRDFFARGRLAELAARVYINSGRSAELAELYHAAVSSPDELVANTNIDNFPRFAPLLAIALRKSNDDESAEAILKLAESSLARESNASDRVMMARVYAAQGRKEEAMRFLAAEVRDGWLPEPPIHPDIAIDPALALLKDDPQFESLRQRILGHINKERAELGPISLN